MSERGELKFRIISNGKVIGCYLHNRKVAYAAFHNCAEVEKFLKPLDPQNLVRAYQGPQFGYR